MKVCPFKITGYKEIIDYFTEPETIAKVGNSGAIYSEPRDACRLMTLNSGYDTCIGEDKCPIFKRELGEKL